MKTDFHAFGASVAEQALTTGVLAAYQPGLLPLLRPAARLSPRRRS